MKTGHSLGSVISLNHRFFNITEAGGLPGPKGAHLQNPVEADLIEGCRNGSVAAFEQLFLKHGERMKSIARNIVGNTADAEDAVQDAFLKIHRNASMFKGRAAFSTWIYRILLNSCYDLMRRRMKRVQECHESELEPGVLELQGSPSGDHPLRITLERSLRKLNERNRTVFLLYEVEGFTHREIAEMLDIPEGTSKNALFEAKKHLQKLVWSSRQPARSGNES
jgi:RNA polymerase sigma-70 factor (ECF subfamily)